MSTPVPPMRERLLDLLVDHRLRQQVALARSPGPPVEGAEVAVGDADVRVVEVAVDDERDPRRVGAAGAELVRGRVRPRRGRASSRSASASSSEIRSPSSAFSRIGAVRPGTLDLVHARPWSPQAPLRSGGRQTIALPCVCRMPLGTLKRFVYASALAPPFGRKSRSKNCRPVRDADDCCARGRSDRGLADALRDSRCSSGTSTSVLPLADRPPRASATRREAREQQVPSRRHRLAVDEPEVRDAVELAGVTGQLEEREAAPRARAARTGSAASRSSARGTRPGSRSARIASCASSSGSARARRTDATRASSELSTTPRRGGSAQAQTANTIGRPVRSSPDAPEVVVRRRVLERALQRRVADQELRVGLLAERHVRRASGRSTCVRTTEVALSGRDRDRSRTCSSGFGDTSWIESTAPSEETQSRGRSRSRSALRAHSIDEIGATSTSPASSLRLSSVGTPAHLLDLGVEPVEDRRHVHVRDAAETDHWRPRPSGRVSRGTGDPD